jgi:hypothetical protein
MTGKDTTEQAQNVLINLYRRMQPHVKIERIFDAYQMGKMLAMTGLRQRFPDASEKEIWRLWAQSHLGPELFSQVYAKAKDE